MDTKVQAQGIIRSQETDSSGYDQAMGANQGNRDYRRACSLSENIIDVITFWHYNVTKIGGDIMATPAKRATVYFDPSIHKALKLKSIETSKSISDLVNDAVKAALAEDAEDIAAFEERANEPLISFSEMLKRLKKDGRI
jgi:hypothetical protein